MVRWDHTEPERLRQENDSDHSHGQEVQGPLLASGKATDEGVAVAARYKEIKDTLDLLEKEREVLRTLILEAANEFPGIKVWPAGDLIIRIGATARETVPVSQVRAKDPELYQALVAGAVRQQERVTDALGQVGSRIADGRPEPPSTVVRSSQGPRPTSVKCPSVLVLSGSGSRSVPSWT